MEMRKKTSGFTLVELMVVVLVAAILVGIAVPSYQSQIRHSRRTDAKTALMDAVVREEKNLTLNNQYTATASSLGYSSLGVVPIGSGYYNMYVCVATATGSTSTTTACTTTGSGTGTSFIVSAIPVAGTSQAKDTSCLYYAVDNTGTQYATNVLTGPGSGTDQTSTCWQ